MRTLLAALACILALAIAVPGAPAQTKRKREADKTPPPAPASRPDIRPCQPLGKGQKQCAYIHGDSFAVHIQQAVFVTIDLEIHSVVPPDARYIDYRRTTKNEMMFVVIGRDVPKDTVASIKTKEGPSINLYFEYDAQDPDRQVHFVRADAAKKDEEVERRVKERTDVLEAEYEAKEKALTARANKLARDWMLEAVWTGGSSIRDAGGPRVARDDFIVLRTGKVYRMGAHRFLYLELSLENRDDEPFSIDATSSFTVWRESGGKRGAKVPHQAKCDPRVAGGKRALCVLAITLPGPPGKSERLRVRFVEGGGDRTVELGGIDVR